MNIWCWILDRIISINLFLVLEVSQFLFWIKASGFISILVLLAFALAQSWQRLPVALTVKIIISKLVLILLSLAILIYLISQAKDICTFIDTFSILY